MITFLEIIVSAPDFHWVDGLENDTSACQRGIEQRDRKFGGRIAV